MSNHLLVQSRERGNDENNAERVRDEVAASVDQGPDVEITGCVQAMVIIKHCLTATADFEHGQVGSPHADDGVDWTHEVGTILALLLPGELLISLVQPDVEPVEDQVEEGIEGHHDENEVEEMRDLVLRILLLGQVPDSTHGIRLVNCLRLA